MKFIFENFVSNLLETIPEFAVCDDYKYIKYAGSGDNPYIVSGVLGNYVKDLYAKNTNDPALVPIADFIELLAVSDDAALKDLFLAGFIENIAYEACIEKLGTKAQQAARELREFDAKPQAPWNH